MLRLQTSAGVLFSLLEFGLEIRELIKNLVGERLITALTSIKSYQLPALPVADHKVCVLFFLACF